MQKDVPLDPGVRAIEVKDVVRSAGKDVVDELKDGTRAVAPGEINRVAVAHGHAEKVAEEDAPAALPDSASAMQHLERGGRAGKGAIADDERRLVEREVST